MDSQLIEKYILSRKAILFLCDLMKNDLEHRTCHDHAIPVQLQILTSLYYLASGCFQRIVSDSHDLGVSEPSVSRIIRRFCSVEHKDQPLENGKKLLF